MVSLTRDCSDRAICAAVVPEQSLSVNKEFKLGESRALQLRFEGFNVLNFQILGTPNTTLGQANTGQVSGVTSTPRQLQLAAKIRF